MPLVRALTASERHIDVAGIDRLLELRKVQLERAIAREQQRAVRARVRGRRLRLEVTPRMVELLGSLYEAGQRHATRELRSMGYDLTVQRMFATPVGDVEVRLGVLVAGLGLKLDREAEVLSLGGLVERELVRALRKHPGARDIASRVVAPAFSAGAGMVYEQHAHLVSGFEWTAVNDRGTCPVCSAGNGRTYPSWEAAQADLPGGGPASGCHGDGRCRCRLVALPPA